MSKYSIQLPPLLALITLAGCGGGGGGGSSAPATPPPPAPTTGTVTGYVTVPGTDAEDPPTGSAAIPATTRAARGVVSPAEGAISKGGSLLADGGPAAQPVVALTDLQVHLRWAEGVTQERQAAILAAEGLTKDGAGFGALESYKLRTAAMPAEVQQRLAAHSEVAAVSVSRPAQTQMVPTDSYYAFQWDMRQIGLERAWDITEGSASVRVAVLDTGIQMNHAEFSGGRLVDGYDFVSSLTSAADGDGPDANPQDETDTSVPGGHSHGTHVAGTIGANAGNGGIVGVDHACTIMPVRVLGAQGSGSSTDIWNGMIYAADLEDGDLSGFTWFPLVFPHGLDPARPRPGQPANIINMSLGGSYDRAGSSLGVTIYQDLLSTIKAKGITIVVAAGNDGSAISTTTAVTLPAGSPSVICVGSVTPTMTWALYSNYGTELSVMAPGGSTSSWQAVVSGYPLSGGILSSDKSTGAGGYSWLQGTSMAAPHVAGVCALMKAVNPGLSPDQMKTILQDTALDLGSVLTGHGLVMADKAVTAAASATPVLAMVANTDALYLPARSDDVAFVVRDQGGTFAALGTLSYSVSYDTGGTDWITDLTIDPKGTDAATLTVAVDRTGIPDGDLTATLTIASTNGGSLHLPVTLQTLALPPSPSFTDVYVLLVDAATDEVADYRQVSLPVRAFSFTDVPAGAYYVVAGTDLNNDEYIDDAGEFFGVYWVDAEELVFSVVAGQTRSAVVVPLALQVDPVG